VAKAEKEIIICLYVFVHEYNLAYSNKNARDLVEKEKPATPFECCWFRDTTNRRKMPTQS
jgi:hypothetical protein